MRYLLTPTAIVLLFFSSGCASTKITEQGSKVIETDSNKIKECKYLTDLTGSRDATFLSPESGLSDAKTQVKNKAAEMGASHIVWVSASTGSYHTMMGRAYSCR